ncbi:MAG: DUF2520 domain-containing protein [Planctomycetes bacterium]|nr:DUF2520 domain-containing protein [Planctomycetota bacterium]
MVSERQFAIVGAGAAGRALAAALGARGARVAAVASRRIESAREAAALAGCAFATADAAAACRRADVAALSVPDDAVEAVCAEVAAQGGFRRGSLVLHLSGALGSRALAAAAACGASALAFHPVQSFARPDPRLFEGIACVLEGAPDAVALGTELARWLGARPVEIRAADKPLYHAALCIACNYMVTLADAAAGLLAEAGVAEDALAVLLPLLQGTLDNLRGVGLPDALTGPISRGDVATLRAHLEAVEGRAPALLPLYRTLGLHTVALALRKGTLTEGQADAIRRLLETRTCWRG